MKRIGIIVVLGTLSIPLISGCAPENYGRNLPYYNWGGSDTTESTMVRETIPDAPGLSELTENSGLSDYLAYATLNNPGLEAAFNRWKAAIERVPQVKSLPDPRFTYRYFIEQVETRVGAQKQAFGIAQMFPWFGKLGLRGDAAGEAAHAARQRYEAVKLKLFFQVKDAYYEYYYLWRAIGIVEENIQLVKNFESVARTRYKAATGKHPDVIRAQVELGKLEDRLKTLQDLQGPIVAKLNAALNRPTEASLPWPKHIKEESVPLTDHQLLQWMADSNPVLKALEYDIARSRTKIDIAKKDYYPDITFGVDFIDTSDSISATPPSDSGQDPIIALFSINLPIWRERLDAALREARHNHRAAVHDKTQKLNTLNTQLKLALYLFRDGERKIDLYRDTLLPKAVESVKANQASFRAGGNTFLDLIDAQRVMLEFELSYERALSNHAQRLAELEMLVGRQIPRGGNLDIDDNVSKEDNTQDLGK
ncbi:MAG: TolC family protein [Planctomycetota bacterium]|jgi:outer membrane protein TolC